MSNINNFTISGHLCADPEAQTLSTGTDVTMLRVAVNHPPYNGEEKVSYFDVKVWGASGVACANYLSKGSPVSVEGYLQQDRWENPEGEKRSRVILVSRNVNFGPKSQETATEAVPNDQGQLVTAGVADESDIPF